MNDIWRRQTDLAEYTRIAYPRNDQCDGHDMSIFGDIWTLDMSCGAHGRNGFAIRKYFGGKLIGFDLPNVVSMMTSAAKAAYDVVVSSIEEVAEYAPRNVINIYSAQHYPVADFRKYFETITGWSHLLYIHTRSWCDDCGTKKAGELWTHDMLDAYYFLPICFVEEIEKGYRKDSEYHWTAILSQ